MDQTRRIEVIWPIAGYNKLPKGLVLVVGSPNLAKFDFDTAHTYFRGVDLKEIPEMVLLPANGIIGATRTSALVGAYKYFPKRVIQPITEVSREILDKCKNIAECRLEVIDLPMDATGETAHSKIEFVEPDEDLASLGYTGVHSFPELLNARNAKVFVRERDEPILYVRIPYHEHKYLVMMGNDALVAYSLADTTITMELLKYSGPWSLNTSATATIPDSHLSIEVKIPWSPSSQAKIRRSAFTIYELDDEPSIEEVGTSTGEKRPATPDYNPPSAKRARGDPGESIDMAAIERDYL